jgi:hypothetical protein
VLIPQVLEVGPGGSYEHKFHTQMALWILGGGK